MNKQTDAKNSISDQVNPAMVFFHLGLEKTGSTFLQYSIFNNLKGIRYHRKSRFKYFPKLLSKYPTEKHLFTFETDAELFNTVDIVAEKIPEANIILILRRQDSWLSSKYNYHIRKHGRTPFSKFLDLRNDDGFLKKESFYLKPKIEYIESKIKGKILFLNYHELKHDPEQYVQRITSFLGAELKPGTDVINPRKKAWTLKQNRVVFAFNKFYQYEHLGSNTRFLNRTWYKYHEFQIHTIAFLARFIPSSWVSNKPLIDKEFLEDVRTYYAEDWKFAETKFDFVEGRGKERMGK